jgi:hypothetical protein
MKVKFYFSTFYTKSSIVVRVHYYHDGHSTNKYVARQKLPPEAPLVFIVPYFLLGTATNVHSCVIISLSRLGQLLFILFASYQCLSSGLNILFTQHGASPSELCIDPVASSERCRVVEVRMKRGILQSSEGLAPCCLNSIISPDL